MSFIGYEIQEGWKMEKGIEGYEAWDTALKWCVRVEHMYRALTCIRHVLLKCPIQKYLLGL